jgi:hypothetical protein
MENSMTRFHVRIIAMVIACTSCLSTAYAQEEYTIGQFQGGLNFMLGFPQGEFDENVDQIGYGINADFGYVFPNMPIVAGLTGGVATYGDRTYRVPFNSQIQTVFVEMNTSNNIAFGHLFLRFQPQVGAFRPYFEGLVGLNYLWTESTVKDERYTDKEIAGSTNLGDVAFSYGAGGGVMYRVYRGQTDQPGKGVEVFVDFRLRYLYGGEAKYFTKDSIRESNGALVLDERFADKSATDMLLGMLGVSVRL